LSVSLPALAEEHPLYEQRRKLSEAFNTRLQYTVSVIIILGRRSSFP